MSKATSGSSIGEDNDGVNTGDVDYYVNKAALTAANVPAGLSRVYVLNYSTSTLKGGAWWETFGTPLESPAVNWETTSADGRKWRVAQNNGQLRMPAMCGYPAQVGTVLTLTSPSDPWDRLIEYAANDQTITSIVLPADTNASAGIVTRFTVDLNEICDELAAQVNARTAEVVTASVLGQVITLTADANDVAFTITAEAVDGGIINDQTAVVATTQAASPGVPQISTVTLGGTLEAKDRFSLTINGYRYGQGGYTSIYSINILNRTDFTITAGTAGYVDVNARFVVRNCGNVKPTGINFVQYAGQTGSTWLVDNASITFANCTSHYQGAASLVDALNSGNVVITFDTVNDTRENLYDHRESTGRGVIIGEGQVSVMLRGAKISDPLNPGEFFDYRHRIVILAPDTTYGPVFTLRGNFYGRQYLLVGFGTGTSTDGSGLRQTRGTPAYSHMYPIAPIDPGLTWRDVGYVYPDDVRCGAVGFTKGIVLGTNSDMCIGADDPDNPDDPGEVVGVFSLGGTALAPVRFGVDLQNGSSFAYRPASVDFTDVDTPFHAIDAYAAYTSRTLEAIRIEADDLVDYEHADMLGHWVLVDSGFGTTSELWQYTSTGVWTRKTGGSVVTNTGLTYTMLASDTHIIMNRAATVTITLLSAALFPGMSVTIKTIQAQTVVSASSNVVPLAGGAAGTAILAATAGKWATLVSDGTNWQIMAAA